MSAKAAASKTNRMRILTISAWLGLLIFVLTLSIFSPFGEAQVLYGSLTGNITDPSNAAIAGATVEALNISTGVTQQATTDTSGIYRIGEVLPGQYRITISAANFNRVVTDNIRVNANEIQRVDAKLQVAQVNQTVTVSTEVPLLQTDRADVHTDFQANQIEALPTISSEGASFQALYRLIPGASLPAENNSAAGNPQRAMTTNVNGQSNQGNNTRIDGVTDAYPWLPQNIAYVPPEDAIETVNIVTNSFDAEQGQAGGAVINVQIKSGTNQFHGDAHELYTGDSLWAQNYFVLPGTKKPLNIFNQFGGAVGGPIKKDKLFFFADEESTRQSEAPSGGNPQTVPTNGLNYTTAQQQGFFDFRGLLTDKAGNPVHIYDPRTGAANGSGRTPISCNGVMDEICLSDVDPAALAMASLIPTANEPGTTNNYFVNKKGFFHRDDIDSKVDYVPNQRMLLFGRYSFSRSFIFDPGALGPAEGNATLGGQLGNAFSRIQVVGLGGTYTFSPNLILDMNFGFTRQRINAESTDITSNYGLDTLHIPGTNGPDPLQGGIPAFQFATNTFSNLGNPNTGNPFVFRDNQYVSNANVSWTRGRHQIRFGIEFDHTQLNHFQPQGGSFQTARGSFRFTGAATEQVVCSPACSNPDAPVQGLQFNSYADFLLGLPDEVGKATQNNDPNSLRWTQWSWYIRDQYQITPKLTVNYGLRWEYYPMAYSNIGGARVLDPATMDVLLGGGAGIPRDDDVNVGHGLFLPRLGVAYRPTEKTVIRAGYGLSGDSNNWRFLRNAYPAVTISDFTGLGGAPFAPAGSLTGLNAVGPYATLPIGITPIPLNGGTSPGVFPLPDGIGTTTIPLDFRRGYINNYNLTVEREFAGFVANVGYVGSLAIRPLTNMNINAAPEGTGQNGRVLNAQFGETTTNGFKGWSDINELAPFGNNYYNALQANLTRRLGGGSEIGFNYTYSRAIDYEDNEEINFILFPFPAYLPRNKAVAGFDRTHNFSSYGIYALPFGQGQRWVREGIASRIVGGWQLNWVLSAMSGTPFTVTDSGAGASFLNAPGNTQTANLIGPKRIFNGTPDKSPSACKAPNPTCDYFDTASFQQVSAAHPGLLDGFFGNSPRDVLRGPGLFNLDMSVFRNFKITERFTFQIQAQAYGLTNTPHFNNPVSDINNSQFGEVTSTLVTTNAGLGGSGGQRQVWLGGKLIF